MERATALKAKWALYVIISLACAAWVSWWFVFSDLKSGDKDTDRLGGKLNSMFFRTDSDYGDALIYQSVPIIIVAMLSYAVVELRKVETRSEPKSTSTGGAGTERSSAGGRWRIGTYPLWIRSPLGVLTIADALFIVAIVVVISYHFGRMSYLKFHSVDIEYVMHLRGHAPIVPKALRKVRFAAYYLGKVALVPFALLWIPVSRGSPFLRLLRIPFERAVKYHIWLAVCTLALLTVHGAGYTAYYIGTHSIHKMLEWRDEGQECSVVAGVVALAVGLAMLLASLSYFRRRCYEAFFAVHHLYIVFFLFWLYHVLWTMHFFLAPALLFVVDRCVRMVQSRKSVDVLSATILDSGCVELSLAVDRNGGLVYHALSTWNLRFPSLPKALLRQQWHFFSNGTSPVDETQQELSILIKPLGGWTRSLQAQLSTSSQNPAPSHDAASRSCPFSFRAGVEGPYGDESDFYLRYKSLVLVGGGIGVTPLVAILRDVLHRYRLQQHKTSDLPTSIHLYHCVRKPEELCVLNTVNPRHIVHDYEKHGLKIHVHAYVTSRSPEDYSSLPQPSSHPEIAREASADASTGADDDAAPLDLATLGGVWSTRKKSKNSSESKFVAPAASPSTAYRGVSAISPTGETPWVAAVTLASVVGFYVLFGISNVLIIKRYDAEIPNYTRVHLIVASMVLGPAVFGGAVVALWFYHLKRVRMSGTSSSRIDSIQSSASYPRDLEFQSEQGEFQEQGSPWEGDLHLRRRPRWNEVFLGLVKELDGQNVGVLVSGAASMQEDIARECRRHTNLIYSASTNSRATAFHYHSVSFEL